MDESLAEPPVLPQPLLVRELGRAEVRAARRDARLVRVRNGAYLAPDPGWDRWRQREAVALAACVAVASSLRCEYAFSHATAALIHGCWLWGVDPLTHITQPTPPSSLVVGGVKRHHGSLPDDDVTLVNGLRVTSLERTVEDCARTMSARAALAVADSALRMLARADRGARDRSSAQMEEVRRQLLARLDATPGRRGLVRARAVVRHADGFAESAGESDLRWIALARGLPRPTAQLPVVTGQGRFFGDVGWRLAEPGSGSKPWAVVMEYDGAGKYEPRAGEAPGMALYSEKSREDAMREAGVVVLRFGMADLHQPEATFARMCRAFPPALLARLRPIPGLQMHVVSRNPTAS
ncbi:hypothetical protein [Georgenia sp. AZ-5]|uniref:hypothetical protein n=1 Tax=Georgenia sp. AZ-5 TaxID=3367526 RepID=UPI0037544F02